ncbi:MAG: peptidylprolyl isomerase [Phenylobacterium sp.]|jgi:peptidylprolyl isomerase
MTKFNPLFFTLLFFPLLSVNAVAKHKPTITEHPQWRTVSPENTLYMETATGRIVFELAPQFAPQHVKHIKQLVRSGFYDGLTFYRVIEQFVAQGGDPDDKSSNPLAKKSQKPEFERTINPATPFTAVQSPEWRADRTGFIDGFAVGRDNKNNKEWLIHCPGVVNLARGNATDSGTTDFAIMMGQSPRHLDRNMSVFGRIIYGGEHLNHLNRGDIANGGVIDDPNKRSKIIKMVIAADLPEAQQAIIKVENSQSDQFRQSLARSRQRSHEFFINEGNGVLDICYIKLKVKVKTKGKKS